MTPEDFCRDRAAPPGSNLYYSLLFHAAPERRALHALFAFLEETAPRLPLPDPSVSGMRIAWWDEELARLAAGQPRHPVTRALQDTLPQAGNAIDVLRQYLKGLAKRVHQAPASEAEWLGTLQQSTGQVWTLAAKNCGIEAAGLLDAGTRVGALLEALTQLQWLRASLEAGRCPLPGQTLNRHGLDPSVLLSRAASPATRDCLAEIIGRLRDGLDNAIPAVSRHERRHMLFCITMAQLGRALCSELSRNPAGVLRARIALTPLRKFWIAWCVRTGFRPRGT